MILSLNSKWHFREKRDEEVVCYGDVGCFRDDGPFDYLDMLPSTPEEVGTNKKEWTCFRLGKKMHKSWSLFQLQKRIVIYYVKKFVKDSQR